MGACLTSSTKRLHSDLKEVGFLVNVAKNAAIRAWERWREDHLEWSPPQIVGKDGKPHTKKDGSPRVRNFPLPEKVEERTGAMVLYDAAKKASPKIAKVLVSGLVNEVVSDLTDNVPYNHEGFAAYKWEAILRHEAQRPTYRAVAIPAKNGTTGIVYGFGVRGLSKGINERMIKLGGSAAVVRFVLFSRESGREAEVICRLCIRKLTPGNKLLFSRIVSGEIKMADSQIVEDNGKWFLNLSYHVPEKDLHLDKVRVAKLEAGDGDAPYPFFIASPEGELSFSKKRGVWKLGHPKIMMENYKRLTMRRKVLNSDYRTAGTGVKGHGKGRFFRDMRPITRQARNYADVVVKRIVADVVKFCTLWNCGVVEYREPPPAARVRLWWNRHDVRFDWTRFASQLAHQCRLQGIELTDGTAGKKKVV